MLKKRSSNSKGLFLKLYKVWSETLCIAQAYNYTSTILWRPIAYEVSWQWHFTSTLARPLPSTCYPLLMVTAKAVMSQQGRPRITFMSPQAHPASIHCITHLRPLQNNLVSYMRIRKKLFKLYSCESRHADRWDTKTTQHLPRLSNTFSDSCCFDDGLKVLLSSKFSLGKSLYPAKVMSIPLALNISLLPWAASFCSSLYSR